MRTAIIVENLSKQYRLGQIGTGTISHDLNRWWHRIRGKEDPYLKIGVSNDRTSTGGSNYVWALEDINFEVKEGEVLGIIGKNGAGKSTLLKILSKVTGPTTGSIKARGRIASLLEVGTGFHPELTGRENIYLNGTILGMTRKEVKKKLDEIVDFAGVARYLDTPVKRYSSGMMVRLGFAVAAHLEPEILIVDEVLAVGDAEFQKKAVGKMKAVSQGEGRTVLFVSHNMASIQNLCTQTMIMEKGKLDFLGSTPDAIGRYLTSNIERSHSPLASRSDRKGNGLLRFKDVQITDNQGQTMQVLQSGMHLQFQLYYEAKKIMEQVIFRMMVVNEQGVLMFVCNNFHAAQSYTEIPVRGQVTCSIPNFPLPGGTYFLHLQCHAKEGIADEIEFAKEIHVEQGDFYGTGKVPRLKGGVYVKHDWEAVKSIKS